MWSPPGNVRENSEKTFLRYELTIHKLFTIFIIKTGQLAGNHTVNIKYVLTWRVSWYWWWLKHSPNKPFKCLAQRNGNIKMDYLNHGKITEALALQSHSCALSASMWPIISVTDIFIQFFMAISIPRWHSFREGLVSLEWTHRKIKMTDTGAHEIHILHMKFHSMKYKLVLGMPRMWKRL
jgi:hypothetical protein